MLAEKINKFRDLFPGAFKEGKIDFQALKEILGETVETGRERYGLTWAGKSEAIKNIQTTSTGTLVPVPEESVNFDDTENLIIEGDNLEVLKLLQKSYHGKIKMIYIDPPYNTGNEFIYPDNFREGLEDYLRYSGQMDGEGIKLTTNTETDGRYHSKWLSMMYPRLFLARNLLREDGVIFVSIDDHEVHNLKLILNEIFGEENFLSCLVWEKTRKNDAKFFSNGHDYILVYARNQQYLRDMQIYWREAKPGAAEIQAEYERLKGIYGNRYDLIEQGLQNFYACLPNDHPSKKHARYKHVDSRGVWRDDNMSWPSPGGPRYDVIHPVTGKPCAVPENGWRYSTPEKMQEMIKLGVVEFRADHTEPPIRKTYLMRTNYQIDVEAGDDGEELTELGSQVMGSYFYKSLQPATKLIRNLFGELVFANPKDHEVLARLIKYVTGKDDIILDFFAGSGSTAHAVLDLNAKDGGNRKFILVQLPEPTNRTDYPTIAEITKERVRRVIAKMNTEEEGKLDFGEDQKQDRGFKVFKLTSSNFKIWNVKEAPKSIDELAEQLKLFAYNLQSGRSQLDILYEILLKAGLPLTAKFEKIAVAGQEVYSVNGGNLLVCLEEEVAREALRGMMEREPQQVICLDIAFKGNDKLKTNTVLEMKSHGIEFHTV